MSERVVHCVKLGRDAPGLDAPPFPDALGQEIFEKVSAEAWSQWQNDMMIKVINEYRLNLADAEQFQTLIKQMRIFLNLGETGDAEVLEVENPDRGKG